MPLSISEFFDRLRESGVLSSSDVDVLWKRIPRDMRQEAAERFTPRLVEGGKQTKSI